MPDQPTFKSQPPEDCLIGFPERALFLDLETCGLAGAPIFLIGLLRTVAGQLQLTQLWARHYGEERAILQTLWQLMADYDLIVTFNGKSFDWPQVIDRSHFHRLQPDLDAVRFHWDLLHPARRRWRAHLPNCRLQTLERYLCGRHRVDDISGRDIPPAYHDYVKTGRLTSVRAILHHNALDVVTLLQLALLLAAPAPEVSSAEHRSDVRRGA